MSEMREQPTTSNTLVVCGLVFAAGVHTAWPESEEHNYMVAHNDSSYSSIEKASTFDPSFTDEGFAQEITTIYASLLDGQTPLGAEFETAWEANIDRLYKP